MNKRNYISRDDFHTQDRRAQAIVARKYLEIACEKNQPSPVSKISLKKKQNSQISVSLSIEFHFIRVTNSSTLVVRSQEELARRTKKHRTRENAN